MVKYNSLLKDPMEKSIVMTYCVVADGILHLRSTDTALGDYDDTTYDALHHAAVTECTRRAVSLVDEGRHQAFWMDDMMNRLMAIIPVDDTPA